MSSELTGTCILISLFLGQYFQGDQALARGQDDTIGATVVGSVSLPKRIKARQTEILSSRIVLIEEFVPSPVPTPEGFDQWNQQKRSEWFAAWEKSNKGLAYQKTEEERFRKLKKHEAKLQDKMGFELEKVAPGSYDLGGEITIDIKGKQYAAEFVAKVKVEEVEELRLQDIVLNVYRILEVGEAMPMLKIDDRELVKIGAKKPSLIVFYSINRKMSARFVSELTQIKKNGKVRLVGIQVGNKATSGSQSSIEWDDLGRVKSVNEKICLAWGVRGLPSLWLVDKKGEIAATPIEFSKSGFDLKKTVENH